MIHRFALAILDRGTGWKVYLVSVVTGTVFLTAVGLGPDTGTVLGIPGSGVSLIVLVAAVLAGPLVGAGVAATLAFAFYALITRFGLRSAPVGAVVGGLVWVAGALLAGFVTDALRVAARQRQELREHRDLYRLLEAGLLPGRPPDQPGVGILTRYIPSEQRMRLGGDFMDVRRTGDGEIAFVLGDVAGHGPEAAALSATMRAMWQGLVLSRASPELTVRSLNDVVHDGDTERVPFATGVFGWLDLERGTLSWVTAGHPPPLLVESVVRELSGTPLLPLGISAEIEPVVNQETLDLPCTVFAYTDGLVDALGRRASGVPGERWLLDHLRDTAGCLSDPFLDALVKEAIGPTGLASDDVAVLALCVSEGAATGASSIVNHPAA